MRACLLVNDCQGSIHGDRVKSAGFETFLAADTANGTVLSGLGAWPFVFAFDRVGIQVLRNDFDQLFWARLDT